MQSKGNIFLNESALEAHTIPEVNSKEENTWTATQTSPSNALSSSAHTTARARTTAPWTRSWWVPTRQILPWTSAPIVSPSARDNMKNIAAACAAAISFSSWRKSRIPLWYLLEKIGISWKILQFTFRNPFSRVHSFFIFCMYPDRKTKGR